MTMVYAVSYSIGGYPREGAATPMVGGVYTDIDQATIHAKIEYGTVVPVEVDVMPPGIIATAKALGIIK